MRMGTFYERGYLCAYKETNDPDDTVFYGKIANITDLVTFQGDTIKELKEAAKVMIQEYEDLCKEVGKSPAFKQTNH